MPTPKALHSKNTPRWGTPQWVIEHARTLMGGIHLDPASSEEFNFYVSALMIYRQQDNGLAPECAWAGNVFCNPPGGLVAEFWNRLTHDYMYGDVEKAFWVGFSVEQLCTLSGEKYHPMDFSTVILRKRLNFNQQTTEPTGKHQITSAVIVGPDGQPVQTEIRTFIPDGGSIEKIETGNSPSHGNYLTAIGCDREEFEKLFSKYGKIYHGNTV
jgi:hypothetical protein